MRARYYTGILSSFFLTTFSACVRQEQQIQEIAIVDETYIHKYGVEVPSAFWSAAGKDGSVVSTMNDGVVVSKSYRGGLLDGETSYSYPHSSQIQKREIYTMGTLNREVKLFYDGTIQEEIVHDSPVGIKTISTWYLSGSPRSIEKYSGEQLLSGEYFSLANQKDAWVDDFAGTRLLRDDYGLLLSTDVIQNGEMILRTTYHPNGLPKEMIPYKNGLVDGTKRTFQPGGEPITVEQWSVGVPHGITELYQHGEKYAEVPYISGKKSGVERRYKDGKQLVQELSWADDCLHGPSINYLGGNKKVEWYFEGDFTTESEFNSMAK